MYYLMSTINSNTDLQFEGTVFNMTIELINIKYKYIKIKSLCKI